MKRLLIFLFLVSFFGLNGCGKTTTGNKLGQDDSSAEEIRETPTPKPGETRINVERMLEFIWWNQQSMVEALNLNPEQRKRMDEHLREFLGRWQEMATTNQKAPKIARDAIKKGDFEKALKTADEVAEASAYLSGGQIRLRAKVFQELTAEQLQKAIDEQPFLFRRRWIKGARSHS